MKRYAIALLFLASALSAFTQDHAPSVDLCRADFLLWNYQDGQPGGFNEQMVGQLGIRIAEMENCRAVDPPNGKYYLNMSNEFLDTVSIRLQNFVQRHGLWDQFLQEDAARKR